MNTATAVATKTPTRTESELRAIADALVATEVQAYEAFIRDRMRAYHEKRGGEWNDAFLAFYKDAEGEDAAITAWHNVSDGKVHDVVEQFWARHEDIYETLNDADVDAVIDMVCGRMNDQDYYQMAGMLAMDNMQAEEEAALDEEAPATLTLH